MANPEDIVRPVLFSVRLLLWISAVIVLGLTAWVVDHRKGYRPVFTLVIAVLTTAFYIPSFFTSLMHRNRGYMLPLDIIFYALWLSAFIFFAQTDPFHSGCSFQNWHGSSNCRRRNAIEAFSFLAFIWTFCGLCLEIVNVYLFGRNYTDAPAVTHPEKPNPAARGADGGTAEATNGGHAPATNGGHNQV